MSCCIISTKHKDKDGYAIASVDRKNQKHHRVVYCEAKGLQLSDIKGQVVRHTCDNPPCINPEHLVLGSTWQNMQDRNERGRTAKGTNHGHNKLTEKDVLFIREAVANGAVQARLAEQFGVVHQLISEIVHRKIWSHL